MTWPNRLLCDNPAPLGRKSVTGGAVARVWLAILALALAHASASAAMTELHPRADNEVLETLAAPTVRLPMSAQPGAPGRDLTAVIAQAHGEITLARQTGDMRYWGRAQALLAPWWDQVGAPTDLVVLQATVQQGRHEFDAARRLLGLVVARAPDHAQAWLDLAALARLQADYGAALRACDAVERAGVALYAQACRLETLSLQGHQAQATQDFQKLIAASQDKGQQSWLLSLLAENLERAGQDGAALEAYRNSLAAQHDLYTAVALSDLLLRTGQLEPALRLLEPLPRTDAVLLRQASAMRRLGDPRWTVVRDELRGRAADLRRRGDNVELHAREAALIAMWLEDDSQLALALAWRNLGLQREPLDWWLVSHSARLVGDERAWRALDKQRKAAGLRDRRLELPWGRPAQGRSKESS